MDQTVLKEEINHATRWLHDWSRLSTNELAKLPALQEKIFCHNLDCLHEMPGECLALTIRYLIEQRVKRTGLRDPVWNGCILLWLLRVYPAFVGDNERIKMAEIWQFNEESGDNNSGSLGDAIAAMESRLLSNKLTSFFEGWPPKLETAKSHIRAARQWLLEQMLDASQATLFRITQHLAEQYSQFPLFSLSSQHSGMFNNLTAMPPLSRNHTVNNIAKILSDTPGKTYIYGAPGSGKTVLSHFVVWRLSTDYGQANNHGTLDFSSDPKSTTNQNRVVPLPLDVRHLDFFEPTRPKRLPALAVEQWAPAETNQAQWADLLHSASIMPVVDNWDSLRWEPALQPWRFSIERELHRYSQYVVFSRSPVPQLEFDRDDVVIYEIRSIAEAAPEHIKQFMGQWASHVATSVSWREIWHAYDTAPPEIKEIINTPLELSLMCLYFVQHRTLPETSVQLLRDISRTLIAKEVRLLSLPSGHVQKVRDILAEIAWFAYVDPETNHPRETILEKVRMDSVSHYFASATDRNLFSRLCDSHFLTLDATAEHVSFTSSLFRDYYAAEKLVLLGTGAHHLTALTHKRTDWSQLRTFYGQLLVEA